MRFEDREIASLGELIAFLRVDSAQYAGPLWYRGQSNAAWSLEPKLMRGEHAPSESHLLNRFKQSAAYLLPQRPQHEFDWLFIMQHHGVSTRLLDWSESPLVALYFAVENDEEDGSLWVLAPCELNKHAGFKPEWEYEIPSFEDDSLGSYTTEKLAAERRSSLQPMAAIAVRNSPRINAQQGVFTISHRENIRLNEIPSEPRIGHVWRFRISAAHKNDMRKDLALAGIGKFQLFPELASISVG
jgi:hypothetical protein